jgi:CDP-diacylglycerol--glycerol-3-phosphate 3-phosphatidyltransferase
MQCDRAALLLTQPGTGLTLGAIFDMTTANKVTIVRILLVPFFIMQVLYYADTGQEWCRLFALLTFAVAALSDGVDGYIARRYNQRSELGAILDPLADKLLLISGIILLTRHDETNLDRIPLWLALTVISRDVILLIGLVIIHYACGAVRVRPHLIGKAATVLQMTAVLWILFKWPSRWLPVWTWGAGVSTAVSGLIYVVQGIRQLSSSPHSSPKAPPPIEPEGQNPS